MPTRIPLVLIPAGAFPMGASDGKLFEGPVHQVTISRPFYLGKFEVTQAQYMRTMGTILRKNPSRFQGDGLPADSVTFEECRAFCTHAGLRLPTEAEWEYAARRSPEPDPPGDRTAPVRSLRPNPLGLCGVMGNVAEWCSDWCHVYAEGPATDPEGPAKGEFRVVRGGWHLLAPSQVRHTMRSYQRPSRRRDFVGFRVALDAAAARRALRARTCRPVAAPRAE